MRAGRTERGITDEQEKAMPPEELAAEIDRAVAVWPSKRLAARTLFDGDPA